MFLVAFNECKLTGKNQKSNSFSTFSKHQLSFFQIICFFYLLHEKSLIDSYYLFFNLCKRHEYDISLLCDTFLRNEHNTLRHCDAFWFICVYFAVASFFLSFSRVFFVARLFAVCCFYFLVRTHTEQRKHNFTEQMLTIDCFMIFPTQRILYIG